MNFLKALMGGGNAVDVNEASEKIKRGEVFILDVRQPDEFKGGHIKGATLIPLGELGSRMSELPSDKDILCVCRSGSRSGMAAGQLSGAGFNVINMQGGMMMWQSAGLPVKRGMK